MRLPWLAPPLAWAALLTFLSSLRNPVPMRVPTHFDKVLHLCAFAVLGALAMFGLRRAFGLRVEVAAVAAVVGSIAFGAADEWHQSFVPGRDVSLGDLAADALGALLAATILTLLLRRPRPA